MKTSRVDHHPRVRIGIAGAGWVAMKRHIPALTRDRRVDVAAVVDTRPGRAADAARRLRGARHFERLDHFLAEPLDAVVVCTPPDTHAEIVEAALTAGLHVLVEKPMTLAAREGERLAALAASRNLLLCPAHNLLFARSTRRAGRLLDSGRAGEVRWAMGVQMSSPRRRLPEWCDRLPGGLFMDETPHLLYLMRRFLGGLEIEDAWASGAGGGRTRGSPDRIEARLRGDVAPAYLLSWSGAPLSEWSLLLCCTERVVAVDLFRDVVVSLPSELRHDALDVVVSAARGTAQLWAGIASTATRVVLGRQLFGADELDRRFVDAVCTGGEPPVAARDGWRVVWLIERMLERCV